MTQVSIYVALITGGAGAVGAAIPQLSVLLRDVRQAERDRRERNSDTKRRACIDLLSATNELLVNVADAADYHGEEITTRLAAIRQSAMTVKIHSANMQILAPTTLAESAANLAKVADKFVTEAVERTDLQLEQMTSAPDPVELNKAMDHFREQAVLEFTN